MATEPCEEAKAKATKCRWVAFVMQWKCKNHTAYSIPIPISISFSSELLLLVLLLLLLFRSLCPLLLVRTTKSAFIIANTKKKNLNAICKRPPHSSRSAAYLQFSLPLFFNPASLSKRFQFVKTNKNLNWICRRSQNLCISPPTTLSTHPPRIM